MDKNLIIKKVMEKKEFSDLPIKDVEIALSHFEKRQCSDEEKVKLIRDLLRKVFSAFISQKLLIPKGKESDFVLRKHKSSCERLPYYDEVYERLLKGCSKRLNVFDLGAGVNGFSYESFSKAGFDVDYIAFESIGQLVNIMNEYFKKNKFKGKALHLSLFELDKIKNKIASVKGYKIIFLMKTVDSLEMFEPNYSKKLLSEIVPLVDKVVVSFATRSLIKREKFKVKRYWFENFISSNFNILDDFEMGGERYLVFKKR